jgi:hypothetical protein
MPYAMKLLDQELTGFMNAGFRYLTSKTARHFREPYDDLLDEMKAGIEDGAAAASPVLEKNLDTAAAAQAEVAEIPASGANAADELLTTQTLAVQQEEAAAVAAAEAAEAAALALAMAPHTTSGQMSAEPTQAPQPTFSRTSVSEMAEGQIPTPEIPHAEIPTPEIPHAEIPTPEIPPTIKIIPPITIVRSTPQPSLGGPVLNITEVAADELPGMLDVGATINPRGPLVIGGAVEGAPLDNGDFKVVTVSAPEPSHRKKY